MTDFPNRSLFPNLVADGVALSAIIWLRSDVLEEGASNGAESFKTFFPTVLATAYVAKYSLLVLWHGCIQVATSSEPPRGDSSSLRHRASLEILPSLIANGIVIWCGGDRLSQCVETLFPSPSPSLLWGMKEIGSPVLEASMLTSSALLALKKGGTLFPHSSETIFNVLSEFIALLPLFVAGELQVRFDWDNPHDYLDPAVQETGRRGAIAVLGGALFVKAVIQGLLHYLTTLPQSGAPPSLLKRGLLSTAREVGSFAISYFFIKRFSPFYPSIASLVQQQPLTDLSQGVRQVSEKTAALAPSILSFAPLSKLCNQAATFAGSAVSSLRARLFGAPSLP